MMQLKKYKMHFSVVKMCKKMIRYKMRQMEVKKNRNKKIIL